MSTPLTDSINALTTYANEVTGASDTTLSDAVYTLASGYGGGGGSGYTRTVVCPQQTVTPASNGTYYGATLNVSEGFEADAEYIITFNGTEYFFTCQVLWGTNYILGDINYFYGSSGLPYPFGIIWTSGTTCTIAGDNGNQVAVKIEKLELTGSPMNLTTKTITQNGTYDAEDDSADGYSSVTVNVPSGASNVVTGTFKSATVGASVDVDVDYSGTGYPIAMLIFVAEGARNTNGTFYNSVLIGANIFYGIVKHATEVSPTYSGADATDKASYFSRYKNSSSDYTSTYTNAGNANIYNNANAATNNDRIVRLRSNKKFAVYMCASGGSQNGGFAQNVDYRYVIVYSS